MPFKSNHRHTNIYRLSSKLQNKIKLPANRWVDYQSSWKCKAIQRWKETKCCSWTQPPSSTLNTHTMQQHYLQLSLSLKIKQKTLLYSIFCCCWHQQHTPNQPKTVTPKLWYEPNHGFCEPSHPYCWAVVASHYVHPVSLLKVVTQIIPLMYKLEHEQPTDFFRDAIQINIYFYNLHCKCTDNQYC